MFKNSAFLNRRKTLTLIASYKQLEYRGKAPWVKVNKHQQFPSLLSKSIFK